MIHYHGGPITPETVAVRVWRGAHAFVSHAAPEQVATAIEVSQSFALDNGAFSAWKAGRAIHVGNYCEWAARLCAMPSCDFAIIPDVIDGTEGDNDRLISRWPLGYFGVPVWHLHESLERLNRLCSRWPRVALGSSGDYSDPGSPAWWDRMADAMTVACDNGRPRTKLHGLRMLDVDVFSLLPFASADSTNVARNTSLDSRWTGSYRPPTLEARGMVLRERIESVNGASEWRNAPRRRTLWA